MSGDDILAELPASGPRRIFACASQGVLAVMLFGLATLTADFAMAVALALIALCVFWSAWYQWQVTEATIVLTREELRTSTGVVLARVDDIAGLDRGVLAFKPSQGFLVKLSTSAARAWAPGLYWRFGRSLGVGGVTNAAAGKFMAEMIQALIAEREAG